MRSRRRARRRGDVHVEAGVPRRQSERQAVRQEKPCVVDDDQQPQACRHRHALTSVPSNSFTRNSSRGKAWNSAASDASGVGGAAQRPDAARERLPLAIRAAGTRLASAHAWPLAKMAARLATSRIRLEELSLGGFDLLASFEASYRWLAEALDAPPRLACLAGNHDDVQHLATALPMPKSLEMDGWRIVLLHTGVPGEDGGHLSESELSFLEETLSAVTQPTLIALHHPPVALGSRWLDAIGLSNAGEFWRLVERHQQLNPFKFLYYAGLAGLELHPVR